MSLNNTTCDEDASPRKSCLLLYCIVLIGFNHARETMSVYKIHNFWGDNVLLSYLHLLSQFPTYASDTMKHNPNSGLGGTTNDRFIQCNKILHASDRTFRI